MNKKFQKISGNLGVLKNLLFSLLAILSFSAITSCGQLGVPVAGGGAGGDTDGTVTASFVIEYDTTTATIYDSSESSDGSALTYAWVIDGSDEELTLEDGIAEYDFPKKGKHTIELTVSSAKSKAEDSMSLTIDTSKIPTPTAAFNYTVTGMKAKFENRSKISGNGDMKYTWSIDNKTVTLINNTYTFKDNGTYRVTLTAAAYNGKQDNNTQSVNINTIGKVTPVAEFSYSITGRKVDFKNESTIADNTPMLYLWEIDNKTFTTQDVLAYTFSTDGDKPVKLTTSRKDDPTYSNQTSKTLTIGNTISQPVPKAEFTVTKVAQKVTLTNKSTVADNAELVYLWELDNEEYTTKDVAHTFTSGGSKVITLTATRKDNDTRSNLTMKTVEIDPPAKDVPSEPTITANPSGLTVAFMGNSIVSDNVELVYVWLIEGKGYNGAEVTHTFATAGEKTVELTVSRQDDPTISAKATKTFILKTTAVKPTPVASFEHMIYDRKIEFENTSIVEDNSPLTYTWTIEGKTFTSKDTLYLFPADGTYKIMLRVARKDDPAISHTMSKNIPITLGKKPRPMLWYDATQIAANSLTLNFNASSTEITDGAKLEYEWLINGVRLYGKTLQFTFPSSGTKRVVLTARRVDDKSIVSTAAFATEIKPRVGDPTARFDIMTSNYGKEMQMTDKSTTPTGTITKRTWSVEGTKIGYCDNKTYCVYTVPIYGTYRFLLEVTNSTGQASTVERQVETVNGNPQ